MSGRRWLHQGRELAGAVLDLLRVDGDALALALEQAHMPRWRRAGRDQRPWRGRLKRLGVRGPERPPMVREELDSIGSGQGQHVIRIGAHMQNILEQLTRGRRVAQRLFSRVLTPEIRQDSCDAGSSLIPSRTQWPLAPRAQPGAFVALQRQWLRTSSGGLEATGPECSHRSTIDVIMFGIGSCMLQAMMRSGSRIDHPQFKARIFRRSHVCTAMIK